MINNIKYLKYILLVIIFSLVFLLLYTYYKPIPCYNINLINSNSKYLDKVVCVKGNVYSININKNNLFFKICNGSSCIDCVIFNFTNNQKQTLLNNKKAKIIGRLQSYKDTQEIIVYKINKI